MTTANSIDSGAIDNPIYIYLIHLISARETIIIPFCHAARYLDWFAIGPRGKASHLIGAKWCLTTERLT